MFNLVIILLSTMNSEEEDSNNYRIARYLLENIHQLENYTITDLANACYVSTSTFSRFTRSIGLSDFSELRSQMAKYAVAQESAIKSKFAFASLDLSNPKDSYIDAVILNLVKLKHSLDYSLIQELVRDIHSYKNVAAFGYLQSENIALNLQNDLFTSGKVIDTCIRFSSQLDYISNAKENNLIIIFSRSGAYFHRIFKRNLPFIKNVRPKIYLITSNQNTEQFKFVDQVIHYDSGQDYAAHPYPLELIASLISIEYAKFSLPLTLQNIEEKSIK